MRPLKRGKWKLNRKALNWAGYAVMALCFYFLGRKIIEMRPDFSKVQRPAACLLLSLLLAAGSAAMVYFSAAAWKSILQFISGKKLSYREIADVYVKSNIAKYLPGNVMHFAGRNLLAGRLGFSQIDTAFATVTEVAVLVVTALILWAALAFGPFVTFLKRSAGTLSAHLPLMMLILAGIAAAVVGLVLYLRRRGTLGKYKKFLTKRFLWLLVRLFCMYSLTLLIPGVFMMLLFAVPFALPVSARTALLTVAAYAASWVAGYVVVGVPGGIGVRESVLLLMLAPLYPSDIVLIVAILSRIVSIAGDAAAFFAAPPLLKVRLSGPKPPEKEETPRRESRPPDGGSAPPARR